MADFDQTSIDFLILADRAEAVNGKLYMLGGGWDQLHVADFNQPVGFSFALGILVPWTEGNEDQQVHLYLESEDGTRLPPEIQAALNTGRPPSAVRGQSFRAMLVVNGAWLLPGLGTYRVVATLANGSTKQVALHALPKQMAAIG